MYSHIDRAFNLNKKKRIKRYSKNTKLKKIINQYNSITAIEKYTYNFEWLGVPVIQYPDDLLLVQEIIYKNNPDLIIEAGIARGGSLIFYSSVLELLGNKKSRVLGIDLDIRKHTKDVIRNHPMSKKIISIQGSSIDKKIFNKVKNIAKKFKKIIVVLDSLHTHKHVLEELNLYSKLVTKKSKIIVFDTSVHNFSYATLKKLKKNYNYDDWGKNRNPLTAIKEFLKKNKNYKEDSSFRHKSFASNLYRSVLTKVK